MKKKKGFTLVEIIAVILVLGIIIILVLPNITGSSSSTKQKAIYLGSNFGQKSNLPYSGYGSGLFYSSNSINTMVYNANNSMKNYDWSSDNRTVTFKTS